MKKPEEIKKALAMCCEPNGTCAGKGCPYEEDCIMHNWHHIDRDALAYIEQLETKVTLMKIQMHGYCSACRNFPLARAEEKTDDIKYTQLCRQCWMLEDKPFWEYEGLPGEVEQHAESL